MTTPTPLTIAVAENTFDATDLQHAIAGTSARLVAGPVATPDEVAGLTAGAAAILVALQPLRAEHVAALSPSVKIIARAGVGLDTIDVEAARARDIRVVYQPTYATNEVADQAASMALASWRRLPGADRAIRSNGWGSSAQVGPIHALQDATLGVLGTGRIGRAVIARLRPFVARVLAFDAYPDDAIADVEWAKSVDSLLEQSNLLTLHLPLLDTTRNIIDAKAIARMPDGAVVVNVSRGGLIDEHALADALRSGKLGGAGLDVFASEPLDPRSELRDAPNLLLSPHIAWFSVESSARLTSWSIRDAIAYVETSEVKNGLLA